MLPTLPSSSAGLSPMSTKEFQRFQKLAQERTGILLPLNKRERLSSKLKKCLQVSQIDSFSDYYRFLIDTDDEQEWDRFYNALTITKTEFFREKRQLDYLMEHLLPPLLKSIEAQETAKKLRIWCAGCSTGEEAYTLAMLFKEKTKTCPQAGWDLKVLASDINTDVLHKAEMGCYSEKRIERVPEVWRTKYFEKKENEPHTYQVKAELKSMIQFRSINLHEAHYPIKTQFDLIFCRNVLIYLDAAVQDTVLNRFADLLQMQGILALGHSEWFHDRRFQKTRFNLYQKQ